MIKNISLGIGILIKIIQHRVDIQIDAVFVIRILIMSARAREIIFYMRIPRGNRSIKSVEKQYNCSIGYFPFEA